MDLCFVRVNRSVVRLTRLVAERLPSDNGVVELAGFANDDATPIGKARKRNTRAHVQDLVRGAAISRGQSLKDDRSLELDNFAEVATVCLCRAIVSSKVSGTNKLFHAGSRNLLSPYFLFRHGKT